MSQLEEIENDNNLNKYKELIALYVKRIISNHIDFKPVLIDETKFEIKIMFIPPEWFLELNDDLQYDIEDNVSLFCKNNYDTIKNLSIEAMK